MSCISPCATCSSSNFYSCLTCDTTVSQSFTLNSTLCQINPIWYIQVTTTCMLALFIFLPLLRKRSMVLLRIFDIIQFASYFKYINGFLIYRHNYLYLDMRSFPTWYEGLNLITLSGDITIPIFTTEETHLNKLFRISAVWGGLIIAMVVIGFIKTFCGDAKMQISKFVSRNIKNTICIAFYCTIQDISFFCAQNFYRRSFSSTISVLLFVAAIILSLVSILMIRWLFNIVNYNYSEDKQNRLYNYELMFMYRMDYDLFQTYKLTNLPSQEKLIHRYSNIILISILYKVGYAFLMASYLFRYNVEVNDQIYTIIGFLVFYWLIWYISMPFDTKNQYLQLIINVLADLVCLALLVIPLLSKSEYFNFVYMLIALSLYGLAVLSAVLQLFLNVYSFIPYDLYEIGLKIVIEDKQLKYELQRRKRQQQQNEKKFKQLNEQHERILRLLQQKRVTNAFVEERIQKNRNGSENSLQNQNQNRKHATTQQHQDKRTNLQRFSYPIQKVQQQSSSNEDDLQKYCIDLNKKRRVYQFDKKKPFVYSNKLDLNDA